MDIVVQEEGRFLPARGGGRGQHMDTVEEVVLTYLAGSYGASAARAWDVMMHEGGATLKMFTEYSGDTQAATVGLEAVEELQAWT